MRRKSLLFLVLAILGSCMMLEGCAQVPAKIVPPGKAYSLDNYGVCFDVKDLKKLNKVCNVEVVK